MLFIRLVLITSLLLALVPLPVRAAGPSVVINELMWMGSSASGADEWIELRNMSDQVVDVSGWLITKKSSGAETPMLTIPAGKTIPARGFFLVANYSDTSASSRLGVAPDVVSTDVSLVNSDLQVKLYDAGGTLVDTADDGSGAPLSGKYESGQTWKSMERNFVPGDGTLKENWHVATSASGFDAGSTGLGTPGSANSNLAPEVTLLAPSEAAVNEPVAFDASESTDPEGDPLAFMWDFGDGSSASEATPSHTYTKVGSFEVSVTVGDGQVGARKSTTIKIVKTQAAPIVPATPTPPSATKPATPTSEKNPTTTAPKTAAPVKNIVDQTAINYNNTGKVILSALLPNPEGADADGETIELLNADTREVDLLGWTVTDQTTKYAFKESEVIKPGERLTVDHATTKIALNNGGETIFLLRPDDTRASGVKYGPAAEGASFVRQGTSVHWRWEGGAAAQTASDDDRDLVTGVVTSLPGTFSDEWFTLVTDSGPVQVYSTIRAFPQLVVGDQVSVTGVLAQLTYGPRLRIKNTSDVRIGPRSEAVPRQALASELGEPDTFALVQLSGELTSSSGRRLIISDGSGDMPISLPKGVAKPKLMGETNAVVTGIVVTGANGLVLRPRSADDLRIEKVLGAENSAASQPNTNATVAVALTKDKQIAPASSQDKKQAAILIISAGAVALAVAAVLWFRRRRATFLDET